MHDKGLPLAGLLKIWHLEPGTKYGYSNSNYVQLAEIIAKVSGESYHEYMENHILKPAQLFRTYYAEESAIIPGRVEGYTGDRGFYQNCAYQTLSLGYRCGDLMSNVDDLSKWNTALLAHKIIKKKTLYQNYNSVYSYQEKRNYAVMDTRA